VGNLVEMLAKTTDGVVTMQDKIGATMDETMFATATRR
jgi:hypothetical protein